MIAYTMTRRTPSYQLLRPSYATAARTAVDRAIDTSSKISKSRLITCDVRREAKRRTGATNRAICVVDVVAIATLRSILFRNAMITALPCSAAFPTIATMITPTNSSVRPRLVRADSSELTRSSDCRATKPVATRMTISAVRTVQCGSSAASLTGEKRSPRTYAARRIPAIPRLMLRRSPGDTAPPVVSWDRMYRSGMTSPITARRSMLVWIPEASRENVWVRCRRPPANMLRPRTRRMFPMIDPVMEALTTSWRPLNSANRAMISSVAFPNVALSRPPIPGPACFPSSSVARPMNHARGMIPAPAAANTSTPSARTSSRTQLAGMNSARTNAQRYGRTARRSMAPRTRSRVLIPRGGSLNYGPPDARPMIPAIEMRVLDRNAVHFGVSILELMENAGKAVADVARKAFRVAGKRVLIVCGTGNNGGDGFVAARHLAQDCRVEVLLARSPAQIGTQEARTNFARLPEVPVLEGLDRSEDAMARADLIIDGLLGIGVEGILREPFAELIQEMNASGKPILSVDVPSGFGAAPTVKPTATAALHAAKEGMTVANSGEIHVADIGIPPRVARSIGPGEFLLYPTPSSESHKGQNGNVLIVSGGPFTGAPALVAFGALGVGADLVHIATPLVAYQVVASFSPSFIVHPLPGNHLLSAEIRHVIELAAKADALAIGPGLGY